LLQHATTVQAASNNNNPPNLREVLQKSIQLEKLVVVCVNLPTTKDGKPLDA
jgi:hypothetical protein